MFAVPAMLKALPMQIAIGVIIALLFALGWQTARVEGFKVWPVHIEGWKPHAERLERTLQEVKDAQDEAEMLALKARAEFERQKQIAAEKADEERDRIEADAMAAAIRHISANRVRAKAVGCPASATFTASEDSGSQSIDGPGGDAELVAVTALDVKICTTNTARLIAAHKWAIESEGVE